MQQKSQGERERLDYGDLPEILGGTLASNEELKSRSRTVIYQLVKNVARKEIRVILNIRNLIPLTKYPSLRCNLSCFNAFLSETRIENVAVHPTMPGCVCVRETHHSFRIEIRSG